MDMSARTNVETALCPVLSRMENLRPNADADADADAVRGTI